MVQAYSERVGVQQLEEEPKKSEGVKLSLLSNKASKDCTFFKTET